MHNYGHWKKTLALLIMSALSLGASSVDAMPEGGVIRSGEGAVSQNGREMTIRQDSGRLAMDWTNFNVGKDETVRFQQPGKDALALNRVTGNQQSVIDGSLLSNGHVLLVNPNGVVIGKNASIDVGGLVASTAHVKDNFMKEFGNSTGAFTLGGVSDGKIINEGTINAEGGLVALHAAKVENSGTITSNGGSVLMAAADTLTLTPDTDGKLNFTVDGKVAEASALNKGAITADGGTIVMTADSASDVMSTVVNNEGTLQARTLRKNEKGQILLEGNDKGQVEVSGTLDASGTENGQDAGDIKVIGQKTIVHDGTNLLAKGDVNGGKIETSGDVLDLGDNLNIDASGDKGSHGTWLLDPLEVVISASKPSSADHEYGTIVGDTNGKTKNNVIFNDPPSKQNATNAYNSTTWIDSNQVGTILSKGTDVIIQAISTSGAASITLSSPIDITVNSSASKNPTFTLEANRNITINQNITAKSGGKGLNIMLNADTDGDGIGAVIINADIATNGGNFTSVTGGQVTHTSNGTAGQYNTVKVGGAPAHEKLNDPKYNPATVGTYFGGLNTSTKAENRSIITNGGAITLNGEVAIGLNGGTLTLDTGGGDLTVTGLINSGNSYKAYIYGTDDWNNNKMIQDMVDQYLKDGTVPAYHYIGITYDKDKDGNLIKDGNGNYTWSYKQKYYDGSTGTIHYVLNALTDTTADPKKSGTELSAIDPRWYTSTVAGDGYDSFIVDKGSTISVDEYLAYVNKSAPEVFKTKYGNASKYADLNDTQKATLKSDISALIAHNWFLSEQIAENGSQGGANVRDSYLATITTRLENSLSTPNGLHTLWVGGRGSGVRGRTYKVDPNNPATWGPADPTLMDGFYWVTGPEGAASTYKDSEGNPLKYDAGTKFWDTAFSDWNAGTNGKKVYGLDPTWSTYTSGGKTITQPDNNGPFLTVGYGSDNQWDDANFGGETTWGFVQETNLANSSLKINTGKGAVNLKGDIGKGQALDTLNIEGGTVQIGDKTNTVTDYHNGTVYVDHGLKITGTGSVTVGGEIHSGESPETDTSTSLEDQYKDNVTIQSGGNLEVHGITSNTYDVSNTDGTKTTRGGKIKLTSTGAEGVITLGDGVDYNGKNTNGGVLKAASTANDSVVIDAQGAKSKFVNETSSTKAIDTKGKWKIYSASPERNTFGKNLNSGTDAQWTTNSTKFAAADSNENKFIFQTTPTITLYVEDKVKTYGDDVTNQLPGYMLNREEFTGVDGILHNVNEFTDAFQEKKYTNYISIPEGKSITVTSVGKDGADGAVGTATRTGGTHAATEKSGADGKNAVYDLNVNLNGATAKNGYVLKNENATLEILKRQASITGKGTQTYGDTDGTIKNWQQDPQTNIADGSTVKYNTSVKSGSAYTNNQKDRNTADYGTYENSVSFDNLKITDAKGNEVNIADNYDLTTTGTIDVAKAQLIVNTDGKTTTYGTVDEDYKSSLDKTTQALNGDKEADLLKELGLTYTTEAYSDTNGDGKYDRTNHVKYTSDGKNYDSYTLDVANTNTLKNYEVTVNDSTVTLERAKAVVDTDKVTTDYGKVDTSYTSHFKDALNGDKEEDLLKQLDLSYSTDAYKDADHTNNVKDGGYDLKVQAKGSLTYNDYDVTVNDSNVTLNKVNLTVNPEDIHRIYGQAKEVQEDAKTAYNLSGFANGDTKDTVDATNKDGKTIDQLVKVTNDVSKALKDEGTHTQNASTDGYDMVTMTSGDLTNYNIVIGAPKKVYLDKATLVIDTDSNSKVYGEWQEVKNDIEGAAHIRDAETAVVNGDKVSELVQEMGLTTSSEALIKNPDGTYKTNHVKDGGYAIDTKFADTITNYNVKRGNDGTETLIKAQAIVDTDNVNTTYGTVDKNYTSHFKDALNGDKEEELLKQLGLSYSTEAYKDDTHTNDVKEGGYNLYVTKTQTLGDYDVTVKNANVTLNPKEITIRNTMTQEYGSQDKTYAEATVPEGQLANGDRIYTKDLKFDIKSDGNYAKSLAKHKKYSSEAVTADAGTYTGELIHTGGGITHEDNTDAYKNYKVTVEGDIIVNPKNITTIANGTGSTLDNLSWDVHNDSLANGDVWGKDVLFDKTYGDMISYADKTFGVKSFINGQPISDGTQIGNYIYHPTGIVQLTFNPIVKPDVWAHSGGYRPRNKIETSLPVFRVEDAKVGQYGTYGVEHREDEDKLVLSATGMRLPEPDQVPDEERTFTTTLSTEEGSGTFKLEYNGVSLKVHPQDKKAEEMVRAGDKTKNVSLSEKALYVGYIEMGLDLIDLKGVYIYFN
nr:filamentous hemagglutinin N-terminal domain-containing protein [uncultured Dialister sp.]